MVLFHCGVSGRKDQGLVHGHHTVKHTLKSGTQIIRGSIWDIPILIFAYVLFWGPIKRALPWGSLVRVRGSGGAGGSARMLDVGA